MKTNHTSVELEWQDIERRYHEPRKSKWSGEQCVIAFMHFSKQNWFMSWEFVRGAMSFPVLGPVFLSHRAPARISDLSEKYPILIEKRSIGRFTAYRLRYENADRFEDILPVDLYLFIRRILSIES